MVVLGKHEIAVEIAKDGYRLLERCSGIAVGKVKADDNDLETGVDY